MPTRKELLEELNNEIERLSSAITDESRSFAGSAEALESHAQALVGTSEALDKHGSAQVEAADRVSNALGHATDGLIAAVVLGGVFGLMGLTMGLTIKALIERVREVNKRTELIRSIQLLQARYPSLSYEFTLDRSYAPETNRDARQTLLNELIHDGLVTVTGTGPTETLYIDPSNPKVINYWEWLDSIRDESIAQRDKLSQK